MSLPENRDIREYGKFVDDSGEVAIRTKDTSLVAQLEVMNSLVPSRYDSIELGYTGEDLTSVIYKLGVGTVSTLTLAYTDSKLTSVVKT